MAAFLWAGVSFAGTSPEPFQSPFRLRVSEPAEGSTVPTASVRVVADLEARPPGGLTARDATPTPRPRVDVFLDEEAKGTLKEGRNSLLIQGVAAGAHSLVVTASDPAGGAVTEKKEIHFTVLPPPD
ncbi:MAG TPA: hypothetical protein VGQ33_04040 [Vicinamibacteria bacterium]|nr:hypothetical protein [Vicinamibacteria bacterium]